MHGDSVRENDNCICHVPDLHGNSVRGNDNCICHVPKKTCNHYNLYDMPHGSQYVEIVLEYAFREGSLADKSEFFRLVGTELSPKIGENIMTLAKQFRDEGWDEGRSKGELIKAREIAMKLLHEKCEPVFIMKITGLSLSEIKRLQVATTEAAI